MMDTIQELLCDKVNAFENYLGENGRLTHTMPCTGLTHMPAPQEIDSTLTAQCCGKSGHHISHGDNSLASYSKAEVNSEGNKCALQYKDCTKALHLPEVGCGGMWTSRSPNIVLFECCCSYIPSMRMETPPPRQGLLTAGSSKKRL